MVKEEGERRAAQFAELEPLVADEAARGLRLGESLADATSHSPHPIIRKKTRSIYFRFFSQSFHPG